MSLLFFGFNFLNYLNAIKKEARAIKALKRIKYYMRFKKVAIELKKGNPTI
jgi:hypothetical protein